MWVKDRGGGVSIIEFSHCILYPHNLSKPTNYVVQSMIVVTLLSVFCDLAVVFPLFH